MDPRDVVLTTNAPSALNSSHGGRKEAGTPFEKGLWTRTMARGGRKEAGT